MAGVRPVRQGGRELGHRGHSGEHAERERRSPGERGTARGVGGARRMPPALAGRIPASRTRCLQAGLGTVPPGWAKVLGQDKATCSWVTKLGAVSFFSDSAVPTEDGEASRESS